MRSCHAVSAQWRPVLEDLGISTSGSTLRRTTGMSAALRPYSCSRMLSSPVIVQLFSWAVAAGLLGPTRKDGRTDFPLIPFARCPQAVLGRRDAREGVRASALQGNCFDPTAA
jgi:hypothetical protein